jgi:predicted amidohydrolase YtcJ
MEARTALLILRELVGVVCFWLTVAAAVAQPAPADRLLVNGRVHAFAGDDPSPDGTPAANAPRSAACFRPDAEAVAIRGNRIVLMRGARDALAHRGPKTRVMNVDGGTVLPGLVDSHTHTVEAPKAERAA